MPLVSLPYGIIKTSKVAHKTLLFTQNDYYEELLIMKARSPKLFNKLSPAARLAVIYYERAKHQASETADEFES